MDWKKLIYESCIHVMCGNDLPHVYVSVGKQFKDKLDCLIVNK